MPENGNGKSPYISKGAVVSVLIVLLLAAYGLIVADTRASISKAQDSVAALKETKLDKCEYEKDRKEFKETLDRIDRFMQNNATALIVHDPRMAPYLKRRGGE